MTRALVRTNEWRKGAEYAWHAGQQSVKTHGSDSETFRCMNAYETPRIAANEENLRRQEEEGAQRGW